MDDLTALEQTGMDQPGNVQQMNDMDANEMARKPKPSCPTCSGPSALDRLKKAFPNATIIQQNNVGMTVLTYTQTTDLATGAQYNGLSVNALPDLGYNTSYCAVTPFAGNTSTDVITGFGAQGSLSSGPVVGSFGGNTSGTVTCFGVGASASLVPVPVTPNFSAGYTWAGSSSGLGSSMTQQTINSSI